MATGTLTAEQALDEVLNRVLGRNWRAVIGRRDILPDYECADRSIGVTYGDLRRWAAPLLATEGMRG